MVNHAPMKHQHASQHAPAISRRAMLEKTTSGIGLLALAGLMDQEARGDASPIASVANPLAVRASHYAPKAKRVIFMFMPGGPSHVDLFDPKPRLGQESGKPLPFEKPKLMRTQTGNLLGSPFKFPKYGQSGIDVSELFPNVAGCVDDLCVIRSMVADNINHNGRLPANEHGRAGFLPPQHGRLDAVWPGKRKPGPAGLCRHQSQPAGPRGTAVGLVVFARGVPGDLGLGSEESDQQSAKAPSSISMPNASSSTW